MPSTRDSPAQALALRGLTKAFDGQTVVDAVTLDVPAGSFFGLVGPNGAGKTTTLSMVTGLLRPDAGRVFLTGVDVWADPVTAKTGWACCRTGSDCSSGCPAASC